MIQGVGTSALYFRTQKSGKQEVATSPITNSTVAPFKQASISGDKIALALQARNLVPIAKTVSFSGALFDELHEATSSVSVCKDEKHGQSGENVGSKTNVNDIIVRFSPELKQPDDAIKTTIPIKSDDKNITDARTQLKKLCDGSILYEVGVRKERPLGTKPKWGETPEHRLDVVMDPKDEGDEKAFILNTKGKLMLVLEDGNDVLLTNAGKVKKRDGGRLEIRGEKPGREFKPFIPENVPIIQKQIAEPSIGKGGEIVIGMEDGRFNAEIIDSIKTFQDKVDKGEIVLPQFVAKEGAENIQVAMLAGGFGSRAEYTNASSSGIFHGKQNGAQSTKGVFRTPTGLTPMETTLVSLHMAGILDCSKGNFGIGQNVKFYLNKSGVNKGNGGFSLDMYNKMIKNGDTAEFIFPNDSISRMPLAIAEAAEKMNNGDTAVAMIAKKVPADEAKGTFGIMKLSDDNEIEEFAEKPKVIPEGYADSDDNCLTNTFQFAVSREAFDALSTVEPYFSSALQGKETRDWSKQLIPTLMVLSKCDTPEEMRTQLPKVAGEAKNPKFINFLNGVPDEILMEAKDKLHGQKVTAVPTSESWADVGQAAALYDVTMQIAKGDFEVLPFERRHVLESINPDTGLVAMTPQQKADIEDKYDVKGEVIAVPKAHKVSPKILEKYGDCITVNEPEQKAKTEED